MSDNKYTRLALDMIIFTIGTVLTKVVQFLLMPLYTTCMTTEAYGVAELTNNMSELLFPVVTLCIYEAAFRYVVGSSFSKEEIFSSSIKILGLSSLIGAAVALFSHFIIHYEYSIYLYIILYAYSFRMLMAYYVRGKGLSKLFALSGIINAISLALFSSLFLLIFKLDVKGYLLAIAVSYISSMSFLFFAGKVYEDFKWNLSNAATAEMLHYCMPLIIYNIGYWLTTMSGRYILLWNTDASTAGRYAAVIKMASVINMLQQAFYAAFQLNTSREYENTGKEKYFSNIFKLYGAGIIMFGSIILCMAPVLAKLTLKNEFYSARFYLPLILFTAIIDCMFCFYKTMYTTYKLTRKAVPSMLIGAVINIMVCLLSVKTWGIWGICAASLLCYASQAIYRVFDTRSFVVITCDWKVIVPCILLMAFQVFSLTKCNITGIIVACMITVIINLLIVWIYRSDFKMMLYKIRAQFIINE